MNKTYLIDTIGKYHLGGLTPKSKIVIKDKVFNTKFISDKRNLLGQIEAPNFDLKDCEFGIYDNTQLLKLLGITEGDLSLELSIKNNIVNKILVSDGEFNLEYSLADIMLIPNTPSANEEEYSIEADINIDFLNKFIKAEKAIDSEIFSIGINKDQVDFILGNNEALTNKVQFTIPAQKVPTLPIIPPKFPIEEFREILKANKDMVKSKLFVNENGLIKIEFENEDKVKALYFLVGLS